MRGSQKHPVVVFNVATPKDFKRADGNDNDNYNNINNNNNNNNNDDNDNNNNNNDNNNHLHFKRVTQSNGLGSSLRPSRM